MDEWDQALIDAGYIWCRPHEEWHRPPECPINEQGEPLMSCGCAWDRVDIEGHYRQGCPYAA